MKTNDDMPIFLVCGVTGEHEDYQEWVVCSYKDWASAEEHARRANKEAKERFAELPKIGCKKIFITVFDPKMIIDYTGTTYFVEEIVLHNVLVQSKTY